jgi:hypothetical protein
MMKKHIWEWFAIGKHPVAMDYFRLGVMTPLANAFANWFENGYETLAGRNRPESTIHSWRFWSRGVGRGSIACGVGRDSSDGRGRPYPLLIMGIGALPGWEDNWDLLTFSCEDTWRHIEHIATGRFSDLKQMEAELGRIKLPNADWSVFSDQRTNIDGTEHTSDKKNIAHISADVERGTRTLLTQHEFFISINGDHGQDSLFVAGHMNCILRSVTKIIPSAVFMGGIPERSYLAIFNRSLNSSDFVRLWSVSAADRPDC